MTATPESYMHAAQVAHDTVLAFRDAYPDRAPVLDHIGREIGVIYFGDIDRALATGVMTTNPDGEALAQYVLAHAPRTTFLMLYCAWELVYPAAAHRPRHPKPKDETP